MNDLEASQKWPEDRTQLQEGKRANRIAHLKWLLAHPWSCIELALPWVSLEKDIHTPGM